MYKKDWLTQFQSSSNMWYRLCFNLIVHISRYQSQFNYIEPFTHVILRNSVSIQKVISRSKTSKSEQRQFFYLLFLKIVTNDLAFRVMKMHNFNKKKKKTFHRLSVEFELEQISKQQRVVAKRTVAVIWTIGERQYSTYTGWDANFDSRWMKLIYRCFLAGKSGKRR